ncbi:hypothetical protein QQG74_09905 [Micromonospora sp. FIMYZ51]|uniref:hypothetical protein n=1 Tax=Micromonospora sp. FIMYZ51 TaxID=3051832 RepID=UPI0031200D02
MTEYSDFERQQLQAVADFNNACLPGNWVSYKTDGRIQYGQTIGTALVVGSGPAMKAIVGVTGHDRSVALSDVTVIPPQPDDIKDDSRDLPESTAAAGRVREYIASSGDGLYDLIDGHPLYARDLEAVCRAVLDRAGVAA